MKRKKLQSCLIGAALAFGLSLGGVGCLVTGFELDAGSMVGLFFACALFAVGSAFCFQLKHGGTVVLCLMALAAGFLWRSDGAMQQIMALLHQISCRYDGAYGWGVLQFGEENLQKSPVFIPLLVIGGLVAFCVSWTVCRRKTAIPAVILSLFPFFACVIVTDTVPKEGYLYILILSMIVLILTNNLRRHAPEQSITLTYMVTVPVAVALGVLFLAVPRESYVNQTVELQQKILQWAEEVPLLMEDISDDFSNNGIGNGRASEVDLENLGPKTRYTYPVMDVVAVRSGTLYLREQDYDFYDGKGWTATPNRAEVFGDPAALGKYVGTVKITTRRARDTVYLPYYPGQIQTLSGGRLSNDSGTESYEFIWRKPPESWEEYITSSYLLSSTVRIPGSTEKDGIDSKSAGDGGKDSDYLRLPDETKKKAKELLKSILTDQEIASEKAAAIREYVRNSAEYDLDTPKMPAGREDFALWFLQESDTGYCVHFATAATVLLRAAGIKARYVTGYMTQAVGGQVVTVIAGEAHAWAEYYEPALGLWIPLDATPPDPDAVQATINTEATPDGTEEANTQEPTETTVPAEPEETQVHTTPAGGQLPEEEPPQEPSQGAAWLIGFAKGIFWLGAGLLTVIGQRQLRLKLRRDGLRKGKTNAQALARWREAELLYRILKQMPPRELESLAQKAKFSQHTLTAGELRQMDGYILQARQVCEGKPWYLRLVYRFIFAAY